MLNPFNLKLWSPPPPHLPVGQNTFQDCSPFNSNINNNETHNIYIYMYTSLAPFLKEGKKWQIF